MWFKTQLILFQILIICSILPIHYASTEKFPSKRDKNSSKLILNLITHLQVEITENCVNCLKFYFVFDSQSMYKFFQDNSEIFNQNLPARFDLSNSNQIVTSKILKGHPLTYLIIELNSNHPLNGTLAIEEFSKSFYSPACSLLIKSISPQQNDLWPLPIKLPGPQTLFFNLFILPNSNVEQDDQGEFNLKSIIDSFHGLVQSLRTIENVIFIQPETNSKSTLAVEQLTFFYRTGHPANQTLEKFTRISQMDFDGQGQLGPKTFFKYPSDSNWMGHPMRSTVCAVCEKNYEYFIEFRTWSDPLMASMYELSLICNGTLELESVFSLPREDPDENGEWDAFMIPLMDGSAVLTHLVKPSALKLKLLLIGTPLFFDSRGFVTASPKIVKFTSIFILHSPLTPKVWYLTMISILAIFLTLELMIHSNLKRRKQENQNRNRNANDDDDVETTIFIKTKSMNFRLPTPPETIERHQLQLEMKKEQKHFHYLSILALIQPLIDQSGFNSKIFTRNIQMDDRSKLTLALWSISLIVLSAAYKSNLLVVISIPKYNHPPSNFFQLINSDYKLGAILYSGQLALYFEKLPNNSIGLALKERVTEYNYYDQDCYVSILQGKFACIGPKEIIWALGLQYMVDVNGKRLYVTSADSIFPTAMGVGVSNYYPSLIHKLNKIVGSFTKGGLDKFWFTNRMNLQLKKGRQYARNMASAKSIYQGKNFDEQVRMGTQILWLSGQLMILGFFISLICFLFEFILFKFKWK